MLTDKTFKELAEQIKPVENKGELARFRKISQEVSQIEIASKQQDPAAWSQQRTQKLRLWLRLIDAVNQSIDPEWDPKDSPELNVMPPPDSQSFSGVDPSAIEDPKLRKQYEEAILANSEKAERHILQRELQKSGEVLRSKISKYASANFTDIAGEREGIKRSVEEEIKDATLRKQLMKLLVSPTEGKQ
ncbi:hypothetical protein [Lacipirellula parvula]|nr:hypothetical protein [Lacipirellula parvula]